MPLAKKRKVLVVGKDARAHALGWALRQSADIYTAPGNPGTAKIGRNIDIDAEDIKRLADFAQENEIYLTVISPEAPVVKGIGNYFRKRKLPIFAPTKEAAEIESSKIWSRLFMARHGIPGPRFTTFTDYSKAKAFLESRRLVETLGTKSAVVKADGLCAGKGAIVCQTLKEAQLALRRIMVQKEFGPAGSGVVIEEKLVGREVSVMAFTDGKTVLPMLPAEDYKAVFDGDLGPNTGGMGGICPHWEVVNRQELKEITKTILIPIVENMAEEGRPYQGIIYPGLMKTAEGFKVLEVNARGGDPETELILPLLKTPLLPVLAAAARGRLDKISLKWRKQFSAGVVLASEGYPEKPILGREVFGVSEVAKKRHVLIFEAGTKLDDGKRVTSGGRVLIVIGLGKNTDEAAKLAYGQIATPGQMKSGKIPPGKIGFAGAHYRTDIAQRGTPRYRVNRAESFMPDTRARS